MDDSRRNPLGQALVLNGAKRVGRSAGSAAGLFRLFPVEGRTLPHHVASASNSIRPQTIGTPIWRRERSEGSQRRDCFAALNMTAWTVVPDEVSQCRVVRFRGAQGTVYGKLTHEAIHNDIACARDGRPGNVLVYAIMRMALVPAARPWRG